ncbi:MAG: cupin domain-containing protein [bacterium]|nr:cupin domain-containing protein [bacterium]
MRIRRLTNCPEIIAGDNTRLRELLHPDKGYPFDGRYSLAHATVKPGETTFKHRLATSEVYYILAGEGRMAIDSESADVTVGDAIEIPPHATQSITNIGHTDLVFLCIVDPAWRAEDEDILE